MPFVTPITSKDGQGTLSSNIIELSTGQKEGFFCILQGIVAAYSRRLEEVETDVSLRIKVE